MIQTPLGKRTKYSNQYDNKLLVRIPRSPGRDVIISAKNVQFYGIDFWNCYEVSWLDNFGKPCVRIMQFEVPAISEFIVESKSLKLYLNSFNNTKFQDEHDVQKLIEHDLTKIINYPINITLFKLNHYHLQKLQQFTGLSIDSLHVDITNYQTCSDLITLAADGEYVKESLYSDLLKSNCLVTNQPDWASIQIEYSGQQIDHKSLLKYIISFRNHNAFHEQCVEQIFTDIISMCNPASLIVFAKYTRRGGIDISPIRAMKPLKDLSRYRFCHIR